MWVSCSVIKALLFLFLSSAIPIYSILLRNTAIFRDVSSLMPHDPWKSKPQNQCTICKGRFWPPGPPWLIKYGSNVILVNPGIFIHASSTIFFRIPISIIESCARKKYLTRQFLSALPSITLLYVVYLSVFIPVSPGNTCNTLGRVMPSVRPGKRCSYRFLKCCSRRSPDPTMGSGKLLKKSIKGCPGIALGH